MGSRFPLRLGLPKSEPKYGARGRSARRLVLWEKNAQPSACGFCVRLLHGFFVRLLRAASSLVPRTLALPGGRRPSATRGGEGWSGRGADDEATTAGPEPKEGGAAGTARGAYESVAHRREDGIPRVPLRVCTRWVSRSEDDSTCAWSLRNVLGYVPPSHRSCIRPQGSLCGFRGYN